MTFQGANGANGPPEEEAGEIGTLVQTRRGVAMTFLLIGQRGGGGVLMSKEKSKEFCFQCVYVNSFALQEPLEKWGGCVR